MTEIIRAVETTIWFGETNVKAYKLQTHAFEKRFGTTGVGESLGYSDSGLARSQNEHQSD